VLIANVFSHCDIRLIKTGYLTRTRQINSS